MATSGNSRDFELALRINTLGAEGITKLEQDVRELAAEGGAAAPQFERLADEIARLGQQARNVDELAGLRREVTELGAAQNVTAETSAVLYTELTRAAEATRAMRDAEAQAKAELQQAQTTLNEKKDALRSLRIETDASAKQTDAYRQTVQDMRREQLASEQTVRSLKDALAAARTATNATAEAEAELGAQYRAANTEANRAVRTLADRNQQLRESQGNLAAAGVATEDLAVANASLVNALNAAGKAAEALVRADNDAKEAARAQGLEEERLAGIVLRSRLAMQEAAKAEADGIVRDFARIEQAERDAATAAQQAAQTIANAYKTVGLKSVEDLRAEITRVRDAMGTLQTTAGVSGAAVAQGMKLGQQQIAELERQIRAATGELTLMDRVSSGLKSTFGQLATAVGVVTIVQRLGSALFDTNKQVEGLRLGLSTIYGSAQVADQQIEFLRRTADRAGLSFSDISDTFVRFSASLHGSGISLQVTRDLFGAVSQAAGTLGLSGERVGRILDALSQMAGKGVVSMEELRQQLGDSLPGALSLVAKGLGITDQQLIKLVESGNLAARDLFPALTKALGSMSGEINTLSSSWERLKNVLTVTLTTLGDTGVVDLMKGALVGLGAAAGAIIIPLSGMLDTVFTLIRTTAVATAALVNGDLKAAGPAIAKLWDDAATRQSRLQQSYAQMIGIAGDTAEAHVAVATAAAQAGQAAQASTLGVQANTGALQTNAGAATTLATAQATAGAAAVAGAAQAASAGKGWAALSAQYAEVNKTNEKGIEIASKVVKAMQEQGKSQQELAQITGNQRAILDQAAEAARNNATALADLSHKRDNELAILKNQLAVLSEVAKQEGSTETFRKQQLQTLTQLVQTREAEADKTREQLELTRNEVVARDLTRKAYEDNSKSLDLLRNVMENAKRTLQDYQALEKEGFATKEQVTQATRRAAEAEGLYRDALKDTETAAQRTVDAIKARLALANAQIELDVQRAKGLEQVAKNIGDETLAQYANTKQKELAIQSAKNSADAMTQEADATIRNSQTQRDALKAAGELTDARAAEIDKTIKQAETQKVLADGMRESAKAQQSELDAQRAGTAQREVSTAAIERQSDALKTLYDRYRLVADASKTADGFSKNADGSAAGQFDNNLPLDQAFKLVDSLKNGGQSNFSVEQAQAAYQQALNAYNDMQALLRLNPGAAGLDYQKSVTELLNATKLALQKVQAQNGAGAIKTGNGGGGSSGGGAAPATTSNHTVTIQIGGSVATVGVASAADGQALSNILYQLGTAKGAAS